VLAYLASGDWGGPVLRWIVGLVVSRRVELGFVTADGSESVARLIDAPSIGGDFFGGFQHLRVSYDEPTGLHCWLKPPLFSLRRVERVEQFLIDL